MPRASVFCVALAGALALAFGTFAVACSSFGATDPAAGGEGGLTESGTLEGGGAGEGGAAADASVDAAPAPTDCVDLASGASAGSGYTSLAETGGTTPADPLGLRVIFPSAVGASVAQWRRTFPAGAATAVTVRIEAVVELSSVAGATSPWFASFAGLSHGGAMDINQASFIHVALADLSVSKATMDLNLFPAGTGGNAQPTVSRSFGSVGTGKRPVVVTLDATWSTLDGPNASAQLDMGTPQPDLGPTLTGGPAPSWTLYLGGSAMGAPALTVLYKRVCITLR